MRIKIVIWCACLLMLVGCTAQPEREPAGIPISRQAEESPAQEGDEPTGSPEYSDKSEEPTPAERFNRDFRRLIAENGLGDYAGLTTEQMRQDLDQLYTALVENYPYFGVVRRMTGIDLHERYRHYREQVPLLQSDTDFFLLVLDFIQESENLGHLDFSGAGCSQDLAELVQPLYRQALQAYLDTLGSGGDNVATEIIDEGKIAYVKINSFSPDSYAEDKEILFAFYNEVSDYENLIIDITANGGGSMGYYMDLIVGPNIAEPLYTTHLQFYKGGELNLQYLADRGVPQELLFPIGEAPAQHADTLRAAVPDKETLNKVLENLIGQEFPPPNLNADDYREFDFYSISLMSFEPLGPEKMFDGDIWVLISDAVYSSSESFAIFCKETGFATLVGEQTGGEGIGSDPVQLRLEHSGIGVRYAPVYGTLLDGTGSQENGTEPDIRLSDGQFALDACRQAIAERAGEQLP